MTKGGVIEKYLTEAEPKNEIKFILTNFIWEPNFNSSTFYDIGIKRKNELN